MNIEKIKEKLREEFKGGEANKLVFASNEFTPIDILEELASIEDVKINSALLDNKRVTGKLRELVEETRKRVERSVIERVTAVGKTVDLDYDIMEKMLALLEDKHTSRETLNVIYKYREELAKHLASGLILPSDYKDEQREYGEEFGEFIDERRRECLKDMRESILYKFVNNPNTSSEIKQAIYDEYNITPVQNAKKSKDANQQKRAEELLQEWSDEEHEILLEDGYFEYREVTDYYKELAANPYTPKEILYKIISMDFGDFDEEILGNKSVSSDMIIKYAEVRGEPVTSTDIALALIERPETSDEIISKLEGSQEPIILLALLKRADRKKTFETKAFEAALKAGATPTEIQDYEQASSQNPNREPKTMEENIGGEGDEPGDE